MNRFATMEQKHLVTLVASEYFADMTIFELQPPRQYQRRRFLMCEPRFFEVSYAINSWMDPTLPTDRRRACEQWRRLIDVFVALGHDVEVVEPVPGLPDMVFAANAGIVIGDRVLTARFRHQERAPEQDAYRSWFLTAGYREVADAMTVNEGEGDFTIAGDCVLAATGFRTEEAAHAEVGTFFGLPVLSLRLVDPRFYHLDTALAVLDDTTVMWYPDAFCARSRATVERHFPDMIVADERDAVAFGLNAVSDGRHVVLPAGAEHLAARVAARGFEPILVDMSELQKAGGAAKCCTLELRDGPTPRLALTA